MVQFYVENFCYRGTRPESRSVWLHASFQIYLSLFDVEGLFAQGHATEVSFDGYVGLQTYLQDLFPPYDSDLGFVPIVCVHMCGFWMCNISV